MTDIIHRIGIKTSAETIYQALTTDSGLSLWWTSDTTGAGSVGSIIHFDLVTMGLILRWSN